MYLRNSEYTLKRLAGLHVLSSEFHVLVLSLFIPEHVRLFSIFSENFQSLWQDNNEVVIIKMYIYS